METLELRRVIFEIKNSLARLNNRMEITEERVNDLDVRSVESIQSEDKEEKKVEKNEQHLKV